MAKSRGRKFAEITSPASGVFDLTSVPTITNAKLQNSAMTLAGSSVSLGGTGVADTDALSEGSSNVYFTDARVQTFLGGGTLAGNVVVPDNRSIYLGSNSDLRIYHDTTNTQLINATGALQITSNGGFAVTGAATFSSTITATGTITGTLATAAQTNITSVGTLSSLTTSGAVGFRTSADSNYAFVALQNSSLTHGGYMSIQGGTATGLEINASASSFSGTVFLAKQSQATSGGYLARFANSAGDKVTIATDGTATFGGNVNAGAGLRLYTDGSNNAVLYALGQNKSMYFAGDDAGVGINALVLDMQNGGNATFSGTVTIDPADGVADEAYALSVRNNEATDGRNYGLWVRAGSNSSDESFSVRNHDNSATYLKVRGDGNVGIGHSSPSAPIDVVTNSTLWTGEFTQSNTSNGDGVLISVGSTAAADYALSVRTNAGAHSGLAVKADGKTGIGTFSPAQYLHLSDTSGSNDVAIALTGDYSWALGYDTSDSGNFKISRLTTSLGTNDALVIQRASGNVGIGETGPEYRLHVDGTNVSSGGGLATLCIVDRTAYNGTLPGAGITFRGVYTSGGNTTNFATIQGIKENTSSGNYATALRFTTRANNANLTEKMRINSTGDILFGGITDKNVFNNTSGTGTSINNSAGEVQIANNNDTCLYLNRMGSNGTLVSLRQAGTNYGTIGIYGGAPYIGHASGGFMFNGATIEPTAGVTRTNNTVDLGSSTYRFKELYLSGGIYVGGTGATNYLDDYEEGNWTPTIVGNSGATGQSYNIQYGRFTKIGSFVHYTFDVQLSTLGTLSGAYVVIGGLPFAGTGNNLGGTANIGYHNVGGYAQPLGAYISGSNVYLMEHGNAGTDYLNTAENKITNSSRIIGSLIVHTAS